MLAIAVLSPPRSLSILFLGNSHTSFNNVPGMVESLIESNNPGLQVTVRQFGAGFVEELATRKDVTSEISSGKWQVLVLQGAKLSSSHRYEYDHSGAVSLAKLGKKHGLKTLLYPEWPRRGWKETAYILKEYGEISTPSGATIVPIPVAWDRMLARDPKLDLWQADGNHANLKGSYFAACMLGAWIHPSKQLSTWRPSSVDSALAGKFRQVVGEIQKQKL